MSVFNGPEPTIDILADPEEEAETVGRWVADRIAEGVEPHEIGIFVRSAAQLRRARTAAKQSGVPAIELSDRVETTPGRLSIGTMHLAKGLEFHAVAVRRATTRSCRCRNASRGSQTMPIWRMSTTPSATCSMSLAPAPAIICW